MKERPKAKGRNKHKGSHRETGAWRVTKARANPKSSPNSDQINVNTHAEGIAKGNTCSFLSIKKYCSINCPIIRVQLSTRNYDMLKKTWKKKRDNAFTRTRLRRDQILDKKIYIYD